MTSKTRAPRKNSFDALVYQIYASRPSGSRFDLYAFELWPDGDGGHSVNDAWRFARDCNLPEAIEHALARWEVYRVNYAPSARVKHLELDDNGASYPVTITHHGLPVVEFRPQPLF